MNVMAGEVLLRGVQAPKIQLDLDSDKIFE